MSQESVPFSEPCREGACLAPRSSWPGDRGASAEQTVAWLRAQVRRLEGAWRPWGREQVSTGWEPLDRLLPEGGVRRGCLVEWLSVGPGGGAATLALGMARQACRRGDPLVVVERAAGGEGGSFYPPAACGQGVLLEQTILVRPGTEEDELWALDQILRTEGVGAVLCWGERWSQRALRRLQLAAEAGGGLGLVLRPAWARGEPCWARLRVLVEPLGMEPTDAGPRGGLGERVWGDVRRLRVHVLHVHGGAGGRQVDLEVDETGAVRVVSPLAARAASHRRRA